MDHINDATVKLMWVHLSWTGVALSWKEKEPGGPWGNEPRVIWVTATHRELRYTTLIQVCSYNLIGLNHHA